MERIGRLLLGGLLAWGLVGGALAGNLSLPEKTFSLSEKPQLSWDGIRFAASNTRKAPQYTEDTPSSEGSGVWLHFGGGYDFSTMGDIGSITQDAADYLANQPSLLSSGGGNNSGFGTSTMLGFELNPSTSLAVEVGTIFNFGMSLDATDGTDTLSQDIVPFVLSFSLDILVDLSKNDQGRTYFIGGAGFYQAFVNYDLALDSGGLLTLGGNFSGNTVGGTLGFGHEFNLSDQVGLDLSMRGRFASIGRVSSDSLTSNAGIPPPGPYSLSMATFGATSIIFPDTNSSIDANPSEEYATLDLTGFDANISLTIHL